MPVRRPGISSRAGTGFFISIKNDGKALYYESTLERDFMYLNEYDPLVKSFTEQPFFIRYKDSNGKSFRYTPDLLVTFSEQGIQKHGIETCVYEVKFTSDLEKKKQKLQPKLAAGKAYAKLNNIRFEVVTEKFIRSTRLANCVFLDQFRANNKFEPLPTEIISKISETGSFTQDDLLPTLSSNPFIQGQLRAGIWNLVANGKFLFDFDNPISNRTRLTLIQHK
jgi:hypothetical protein